MDLVAEGVGDVGRGDRRTAFVGKHDADIMVGLGNDMVARSDDAGEGGIPVDFFGKPFFIGFPFLITLNPALIELQTFLKWELKGKTKTEVEVDA